MRFTVEFQKAVERLICRTKKHVYGRVIYYRNANLTDVTALSCFGYSFDIHERPEFDVHADDSFVSSILPVCLTVCDYFVTVDEMPKSDFLNSLLFLHRPCGLWVFVTEEGLLAEPVYFSVEKSFVRQKTEKVLHLKGLNGIIRISSIVLASDDLLGYGIKDIALKCNSDKLYTGDLLEEPLSSLPLSIDPQHVSGESSQSRRSCQLFFQKRIDETSFVYLLRALKINPERIDEGRLIMSVIVLDGSRSFRDILPLVLLRFADQQKSVNPSQEFFQFDNVLSFPVLIPFSSEPSNILQRERIHEIFGLPRRPLFNPKLLGIDRQPWLSNGELVLCPDVIPDHLRGDLFHFSGTLAYYHYVATEGFSDVGWGCAYRTAQMMLSWLYFQGFEVNCCNPTHFEIQSTLVSLGDKESSIIGSKEWIGAVEVSILLNYWSKDVESRIVNVSKGGDFSAASLAIAQNFDTHGAPVMVGGGNKAYLIIGLRVSGMDSEWLILDPHYEGDDNYASINRRGIFWAKTEKIFDQSNFFNFTLMNLPEKF